jgi:succinyl-CoA synthetase beta subunit
LVSTPQQAADTCAEIGPVVLKAQILSGKRGRAGGILPAATPSQAAAVADSLLGKEINGLLVERLLCEQKLEIAQELYVAVAVDGAARKPVLILSAQGGVSVEEVAERSIVRRHIDLPWGLFAFMTREAVRRLEVDDKVAAGVVDVCLRMYRVFRRHDAEMVEINPLAVLPDDTVMAADARITVDDDAAWRQRDLPAVSEYTDREQKARDLGFSFVELGGDIAVLANGAGITMATLDLLQRFGGRPANFLDVGGGADAARAEQALDLLLSDEPKALLVNIFGGITRCDDVATAVVRVIGAREAAGKPRVPVVVRLAGTHETEGAAILAAAGITTYRSMEDAAARTVALAGGGTR